MKNGFYCLTCCFDVPTGQHLYEHCCGYTDCRVIPIATLCSEPTVIDESDLAPGMVVVTVDYRQPVLEGDDVWLMCPSTCMTDNGLAVALRGEPLATVNEKTIRKVAGRGRP